MEQENKSGESEKKQISILRSGNSRAIIDTVEEIREGGSLSILPEVFDVLLQNEDENVIAACSSLLNDLKSEAAAEMLISAIKNERYEPIRSLLLSACWQNGLDYHKDILLFADLLIKDDYLTAIEAFTVIESNIGALEDQDIVRLLALLKANMTSINPDKKPLLETLIALIRNY